jgi:hypothetical protein
VKLKGVSCQISTTLVGILFVECNFSSLYYAIFCRVQSSEADVIGEEGNLDAFSLDDKKRAILRLKDCILKSNIENAMFKLLPNELDTHLLYEIIKLMLCQGNANDICKAIMNVKALKNCLWSLFMDELAESAKYMCQKKRSYLSQIDYDALQCFEWEGIIEEMFTHQRQLLQVLVTASTCARKTVKDDHYSDIAKEIGLIYGILMKRRCNSLSRVQRVVSITLAEECVHQKVRILMNNHTCVKLFVKLL